MRRIRAGARRRALGALVAVAALVAPGTTALLPRDASAQDTAEPPVTPGPVTDPAMPRRADARNPALLDPYDQLIDGGVAEFASGHWSEARTLFERAHLLRPSARTLRALGMCAFNLHRYAQAVAELEAAQREREQPLDGSMEAQVDALLNRAAPFVGRFEVALTPPHATLAVDDAAPVRDPDGRVLLDIGHHQLAIEAPGHATSKQALEVHGGEDDAIALHALPLVARTRARAPAARKRVLSRRAVLALSLASVGLVTAAGGLASWMRAGERFDDLASGCRAQGGCLPGTVDLARVRTLEHAAYGLGGAGAGLVISGAVLGAFELFGADRGVDVRDASRSRAPQGAR